MFDFLIPMVRIGAGPTQGLQLRSDRDPSAALLERQAISARFEMRNRQKLDQRTGAPNVLGIGTAK